MSINNFGFSPFVQQQQPMLVAQPQAVQPFVQPQMAQSVSMQPVYGDSNMLSSMIQVFSQMVSMMLSMFQTMFQTMIGGNAMSGTPFADVQTGGQSSPFALPTGSSMGLADGSMIPGLAGVSSNPGLAGTTPSKNQAKNQAKNQDTNNTPVHVVPDPNHKTRKVPGRRFYHSHPYYKANSPQGLETAHAKGYKWQDLDFRVTKDGVPVCIHGAPENAFLNGKQIENMTWDQVSKLRHNGYRIHTAAEMLAKAQSLGMNIEFEAKGSRAFQSPQVWNAVSSAAQQAYGNNWQQHVQVKTLSNLTGGYDSAHARLVAAHNAGFTTILLPRGQDRFRLINDPAIDYVRGSARKYPK